MERGIRKAMSERNLRGGDWKDRRVSRMRNRKIYIVYYARTLKEYISSVFIISCLFLIVFGVL